MHESNVPFKHEGQYTCSSELYDELHKHVLRRLSPFSGRMVTLRKAIFVNVQQAG